MYLRRCPWPLHLTSPPVALSSADPNPEQEVTSSSVHQSDEKRGMKKSQFNTPQQNNYLKVTFLQPI